MNSIRFESHISVKVDLFVCMEIGNRQDANFVVNGGTAWHDLRIMYWQTHLYVMYMISSECQEGILVTITMTSQWSRWRLKSPVSRLFTWPFIQAQVKENPKAPRHWPLWGEFTGGRWIPRTKGQKRENVSIWWRHNALSLLRFGSLRKIHVKTRGKNNLKPGIWLAGSTAVSQSEVMQENPYQFLKKPSWRPLVALRISCVKTLSSYSLIWIAFFPGVLEAYYAHVQWNLSITTT